MPLIIAHRGASAEAPENTIRAIQQALDIGVDYIEIDIHLSLESIPVVIHDPTPKRVTVEKNRKKIENMRIEEIRNLDVGTWFDPQFSKEKIPTLSEVLALNLGSSGLMIEIKKGETSPRSSASAVIKTIGNEKKQNLWLGSFSPEIIQAIHDISDIPIMGIIEKHSMLSIFRKMNVSRLAIWYKMLNPDLINSLHDEGIEVWAFTVDSLKDGAHLISMNIDGLITNNPRLFKKNF